MISIYNHVFVFKNNFDAFGFVLINEGYWILNNLINHAVFIHASSSTTQEAEKTSIIIGKIMTKCGLNTTIRTVFKDFLAQNQNRRFKLETCFFVINWKLLLSILSTTVTYLIIICQFDLSVYNYKNTQ
jgi:hypothetical protein